MADICFIDTETTSLRHDRRAWEIGIIARTGDRDVEHHWFIDAGDLNLGNADPFSLSIGKFHDRHPQYRLDREPLTTETGEEADVLRVVEAITRGAHLIGAVVNFDADVLGARMRKRGICPSWHYHLIDCEALAVGYINGRRHGESQNREWSNALAGIGLPWKSDELSAVLGIKISEGERHTALGDARWARAIYDAVTGGPS